MWAFFGTANFFVVITSELQKLYVIFYIMSIAKKIDLSVCSALMLIGEQYELSVGCWMKNFVLLYMTIFGWV